jgi:hypothetical protein
MSLTLNLGVMEIRHAFQQPIQAVIRKVIMIQDASISDAGFVLLVQRLDCWRFWREGTLWQWVI